MALLEARGLVKQYGRRTVVDGVELEVNAGEIVGLLGPNGAGKTTSFRMIAGMVTPNRGTVAFNGRDVTQLAMYRRARLGLGYLAQEQSIFRKLTVEQNIHAILELITTCRGKPARLTGQKRRERVDQLLEQFGLNKVRTNLAALCSGGEKRRLEIARCLASEPMVILLDEPFTGIDPITVGDIQQIVRGLRQDGIGILITDHHVAETLRITDRSYLVAAGKPLVHGTPLEIVNDAQARKVYLGENFHAGSIGTEVKRPRPQQLRALLETVEVQDLIAQLGGADATLAEGKLRARGPAVVPTLVEALGRSDTQVRVRAHRLLCDLLGVNFPFDPHGHELTRGQQIACIREYLANRLAA